MADQEIDRLLLEIEVEDKTQGGSKKLVGEFATAISKLQAEINKLDTSKLEAVSKALSFSVAGGGGAKGTSAIGKQSDELKKARKELAALEKEYDTFAQAGVNGDTLASIREQLGIDEAQKRVDELSTQGGVGSAIEGVEQTTKDWSEEVGEINTKMDYLQAKAELVQESLEKGVKTKRAYVNLKGQEISLDERITKEIEKQEKAQADLDKKAKDAGIKQSLGDLDTPLQALQAQLTLVNEKLKNSDLTAEQYVRLRKQALSLEQRINKEKDKGNKTELSNLFASIKRVATYRLIRAAIKFILDALKEGAEQIAQISPEFNQTWSSVLASMDKIKGALATIGANLLPIIEPILRIVADLLVTVSNTIGKILAAFNGTGKAIQANTKHQRDYNKELQKGALLSFDTFTTLKAQEQSDLYSVEDTGELGSGLAGLLDSITPIMNFVNELITTITDVLMPIIVSVADVVDGAVDQIKGAFKMIVGLLKLLTGDFEGAWDLIGEGFVDMINGIANMFIALGKFIIDALNLLIVKNNPLFWILKSAGIDIGGKIDSWNADWSAKAWNPIKNHAFGGDYNSADLFYANENGQTELIASTNSGGGAVMNMQQLESAIYSGMVKAMASGENGESAIYLDGNKVGTFIAGNNGFRSEANRRNTGLNWR